MIVSIIRPCLKPWHNSYRNQAWLQNVVGKFLMRASLLWKLQLTAPFLWFFVSLTKTKRLLFNNKWIGSGDKYVIAFISQYWFVAKFLGFNSKLHSLLTSSFICVALTSCLPSFYLSFLTGQLIVELCEK